MSEELFVVGESRKEWDILKEGTKVDEETGIYKLVSSSTAQAVEVTRSVFALTYISDRNTSHLNWMMGDILQHGYDRWGDDYYQHLDQMIEMVGWSKKLLDQRERTSAMFCVADLRCLSYDKDEFAACYPTSEVMGVTFPLSWEHYRQVGLYKNAELPTKMLALKLAWKMALTGRQTRSFLEAVYNQGKDLEDTLRDLLESAEENEAIAEEKMGELSKEADHRLGGKYLCLFVDDEEGVRVERHLELSPKLFDDADQVVKLVKGRPKVLLEYDGFSEQMEEIPTED